MVVRHSFLDHGHNHLVDQNFNPLPVGLPGGIALALAAPRSFVGRFLSLWRVRTLFENEIFQMCFLQD